MKNQPTTKSYKKRYVFISFDNLKLIKFKKLEKVCDKVFIFIGTDVEEVPFKLVKQIQKMGKDARWIEVDSPTLKDIQLHLSFYMGSLHQKIDPIIEFAILSNDLSFDSLINFINLDGRNCLRVKTNSEDENEEDEDEDEENEGLEDFDEYTLDSQLLEMPKNKHKINGDHAIEINEGQISDSTKRIIEKLVHSGNRPADQEMLRHYIMMEDQDIAVLGGVDKIISKLVERQEIKINGKEVTYNF